MVKNMGAIARAFNVRIAFVGAVFHGVGKGMLQRWQISLENVSGSVVIVAAVCIISASE